MIERFELGTLAIQFVRQAAHQALDEPWVSSAFASDPRPVLFRDEPDERFDRSSIQGAEVQPLGKIQRRIEQTHHVRFSFDEALVDAVAASCTEVESGARNVDNILTKTLLPEVSVRILEQLASGDEILAISVGVTDDGAFAYRVDGRAASASPGVSAPGYTMPMAQESTLQA